VERSARFPLLLAAAAAVLLALGIFFSLPGGRGQLWRVAAVGWPSAGAAALLGGAPGSGTMVELTVQDVIPIAEANAHAVVLTSPDEQVLLPIFVTEEAAVSIAFRLAHQDSPHPLAADLLDDVVSIMGGQVTEVRIDDVRDDIYTSHVVIRQGGTDHKLSARPSDAIAMALTGKAKIFCAEQVLSQAGISRREIDALREQMGVGGGSPPGGPPTRPEKTPGMKKAPPRDDIQL
jgi:bifunctional DNase/RNase